MATTNTLAIRNVARTTDAPEPVVLHPVGYLNRDHRVAEPKRVNTGMARGKSKARVGKAAPCKHRTSTLGRMSDAEYRKSLDDEAMRKAYESD